MIDQLRYGLQNRIKKGKSFYSEISLSLSILVKEIYDTENLIPSQLIINNINILFY